MKLTEIWNRVKYGLVAWDLAESSRVRRDLESQGWTFETSEEPFVVGAGMGPPVVVYPKIVKNPQGESTRDDPRVMAQYDEARRTSAARIFGINQPAP